jgi:hypothetical protein
MSLVASDQIQYLANPAIFDLEVSAAAVSIAALDHHKIHSAVR